MSLKDILKSGEDTIGDLKSSGSLNVQTGFLKNFSGILNSINNLNFQVVGELKSGFSKSLDYFKDMSDFNKRQTKIRSIESIEREEFNKRITKIHSEHYSKIEKVESKKDKKLQNESKVKDLRGTSEVSVAREAISGNFLTKSIRLKMFDINKSFSDSLKNIPLFGENLSNFFSPETKKQKNIDKLKKVDEELKRKKDSFKESDGKERISLENQIKKLQNQKDKLLGKIGDTKEFDDIQDEDEKLSIEMEQQTQILNEINSTLAETDDSEFKILLENYLEEQKKISEKLLKSNQTSKQEQQSDKQEQKIKNNEQKNLLQKLLNSIPSKQNNKIKPEKSGKSGKSGGGLGGFGEMLAGAGAGLGAAGLGLGGFFMGLAGAEAIMTKFGSGDNLKNLMKNLSEGLSYLTADSNSLLVLGSLLGAGALFGAVGGIGKSAKASVGMGAIGLGIGAFFAGLGAGDAGLSWMNVDGSKLKNMMKNVSEGLSYLVSDQKTLITLGSLLGAGALFGAVSGAIAGKASVGMGAIGLGIGAFFAGLGAGDAGLSWMNVDGSKLKDMMKNVSEGLSYLVSDQKTLITLGSLLGAGALFGAVSGAIAGKASVGMGAIGLGIGAFFAGLGAGDAGLSWMNVDGSKLKDMMKNLSEGLSSFDVSQLKVLGSLLAAGGIFGAIPGGLPLLGKAAVGLGLVGAGIGAFFLGIGGTTKLGELAGVDGSSTKNLMTNLAAGLNKISEIDGSNLLNVASGLKAIGPALLAFFAGDSISKLKSSFDKGWSSIKNFFGIGGKEDKQNNMISKIVEILKPLESIDGNKLVGLSEISIVLERFADSLDKISKLKISDIEKNIKSVKGLISNLNISQSGEVGIDDIKFNANKSIQTESDVNLTELANKETERQILIQKSNVNIINNNVVDSSSSVVSNDNSRINSVTYKKGHNFAGQS